MKLNLIPLIVIGALGAGIWWWLKQPTDTYIKDIYYGGQTWQSVLIKHYRSGAEVATLPDGTKVTWSNPGSDNGEWILF